MREKKNAFEAILVLGVELGAQDVPTQELCLRIAEAAKAYHEGLAKEVIACGGILPGHARAEAEVICAGLRDAGVPQHAIRLEDRSQNTMENFRFAARMLSGSRRVLVVTSDYHVCRAVATARRTGLRACGRGARLPRGAAWWSCLLKECCYTLDLFLGWQDGEGRRPAWTRPLFNRIFGIQA